MNANYQTVSALQVKMHGQVVGELTKGRTGVYFTYASTWLASGFNLSPFMQFNNQPQLPPDRLFGGIHGAFADSLPDGWGLLLMDRFFSQQFGAHVMHSLSQLDRLAYIGDRGMGALEYYPIAENVEEQPFDLIDLFNASMAVELGSTEQVLKALRLAGGSPGGARPKAAVTLSPDLQHAASAFSVLKPRYKHWIVKFRHLNEPVATGAIEYVYAQMARNAGVDVAPFALIPVTLDATDGLEVERFFASQRFDRLTSPTESDLSLDNTKRHMMTVAGLLHADYRLPCMDYKGLLQLTFQLTKSAQEVEKMARLMIFNALAHNRDDHVKNFAFLFTQTLKAAATQQPAWHLSPAYDLTFSTGMGEHTTAFNGQGRPTRQALRRLCSDYKYLKADDYIDQTLAAINQMSQLCDHIAIPTSATKEIIHTLSVLHKNF